MYRNVLVATDDSPQAEGAVARAIDLAEAFDADLHVLYVVDERLGRTAATRDPYEGIGKEALSEAERDATVRDVRVTTSLEEGHPASEILDYAADHAVDLIVVGGTGKSAVERFFIGTTAERVVRKAGMSVLVVRERDE